MNPQFAEILHIAGYQMAMCCEPLGAQFAQSFQGRRACDRGYEGTWELQDGCLYLVKLVGTLRNGREASVATFFPSTPDRALASWYSGPLIEPESNPRKYIYGSNCVYDCDLFIDIEMGLVSEAYLSRSGGPKDYAAAAERYGREIGKVLVNGVDVNLEQVQRGFAWHYKAYEREQAEIDRKV